ncbi:hypothetical protein LTR08_001222 [Meristemomyces frigidus]|nr:hypothetical protein LTR08_001222 [Meristemomyces frigidus]
MLLLKDILAMSASLRLVTFASILFLAQPTVQQTSTTCNPTAGTCPADPALGKSLQIDFTSGASDSFTKQGAPTYDSNGASFTVAQSGDAPTLISTWYIMFGHVEVKMKAAPGTGIVSSCVLQSDDLDEIDWEWLGGSGAEVQSNYFGKGQTTTYDRAAVHAVTDSQGEWHTYAVDWTETQIVWQIDGKTVRVLSSNDANGQYPQTPMQLKLGSWAGGDPANPAGTISWAGGDTDYSAGPFTMIVQSLSVTDYSTGTQYEYGNESGNWTSIESTGGSVNGNAQASDTAIAAPAITSTSSGDTEPFSGTHASCSTCSTPGVSGWTISTVSSAAVTNTDYPGLPSGWTVSSSGKVIPPSAAPVIDIPTRFVYLIAGSLCSGLLLGFRGFLTTATLAAGISTGYDDRGYPTTVYPSNCLTKKLLLAEGEILRPTALAVNERMTTSSGRVLLPTATGIITSTGSYGSGSQPDNSSWTSRIVANAVERTYDTLFTKNFVPWKFHPRFSDFEPALTSNSTYVRSITLQQSAPDPATIMKPTAGSVDESYTLDMLASGDVTITAASSIGLLHGLTTLTQLFYECSGGGVYTALAPVHITDAPKFPWRGLNVDTARTFKPMSDLKAMIDALSYNKMNRLHWHITDAQSWPLEIPSLPALANKGAYASFQKYSPADVQALQEYGALLGVEVVMEIDNPGHTSSIAFAYPDLIAAFNVQPNWDSYAAEPPSGTLKLKSSAVSEFLETLFDDLLPRLKPLTSYFHLGGDEVNMNAYTLDDTVGTNASSVLQPLMQKYMDRNMQQVLAAGLVPLVWEEMLLDWNLTLPAETIVQTWLSDESVAETVAKGHKALAGNYNFWYLDCGQGQWLDFYPKSSAAAWPYADYCSPRHNWRLMYSYDPLAGVPANATHLVLGGEAHIWSEQTDTVNLDQMVWPRTCAAGEVLWSGAKDAAGQNRSQITASPRLSEMRERLVARGIRAEPIQMTFCTQNGTQCAS